jgi:hypothetical protein
MRHLKSCSTNDLRHCNAAGRRVAKQPLASRWRLSVIESIALLNQSDSSESRQENSTTTSAAWQLVVVQLIRSSAEAALPTSIQIVV